MSKILMTVIAAGLVLPLCVGCSQNGNLVRGQSAEVAPETMYGPGPMHGGMPGQGYPAVHTVNGPYDPAMGAMGGAYCPPNAYGGLPDCRYRGGVLPPAGDVPAVVQYPYYTVKGPDCFFHQ